MGLIFDGVDSTYITILNVKIEGSWCLEFVSLVLLANLGITL